MSSAHSARAGFPLLETAIVMPEFARQVEQFRSAIESLASRRLVLFGGKGGVGKTTVASIAALHLAEDRPVTLMTTDPASNLQDLFADRGSDSLQIESLDADGLWRQFLDQNLESLLELADRATWLDREELRRFFELAIPGIDELMAWRRIGELAATRELGLLIVDTAPTGHTLRMLASSEHFRRFGAAMETMQDKHREIVVQLTRRDFRDVIDEFLERFETEVEATRELLRDESRSCFIPVLLAEPWVVRQTERLIEQLHEMQLTVPFAILNQSVHDCRCRRCKLRRTRERAIRLSCTIVPTPRSCVPLDRRESITQYLAGEDRRLPPVSERSVTSESLDLGPARLLFVAGKGGVGKTSAATSISLQLAHRAPEQRFVLISVDPAHSVRDVFADQPPPENLSVEIVDTRKLWDEFRNAFGDRIREVMSAMTPGGLTLQHDEQIMQQLIDMAPPGADELFAVMRLASLLEEPAISRIVVDTAPTGHFLRLLELPASAGAWVREFMRLLLRYREILPVGSLGHQLLDASRALRRFEETLASPSAAAVVVLRPEPPVIAETLRLVEQLTSRGLAIAGLVANHVTPPSRCGCDRSVRAGELQALQRFSQPLVTVPRTDPPPVTMEQLAVLIPLDRSFSLETRAANTET